jgi:hypothetical protein
MVSSGALDALACSLEGIFVMTPFAYRVLHVMRDLNRVPMATPGPSTPVAQGSDHPTVNALARDIYSIVYARILETGPQSSRPDRLSFVGALARANASTTGWDSGWALQKRTEQGRLRLRQNGFLIDVESADVHPDPVEGSGPDLYEVRVGREIYGLLPGWYVALGETPEGPRPPQILTRLYWNVGPSFAAPLLSLITTRLNEERVPFRIKVPNSVQGFGRADTAVLYIRKPDYLRHRHLIGEVHAEVRGLRQDVPAFTKRLASGLGVAEDPGGGFSFGQHRSWLIARGLWRAFRSGAHSLDARMHWVQGEFRRAGIDACLPYLAPGSADLYEALAS